MFSRRTFVLGGLLATAIPGHSVAAGKSRRGFRLAAKYRPQIVRFSGHPVGTLGSTRAGGSFIWSKRPAALVDTGSVSVALDWPFVAPPRSRARRNGQDGRRREI